MCRKVTKTNDTAAAKELEIEREQKRKELAEKNRTCLMSVDEIKTFEQVMKKENYLHRKRNNVLVSEAFGRLVCCNFKIRLDVLEFRELSVSEVQKALKEDTYRTYSKSEIRKFLDEFGINYKSEIRSPVTRFFRKLDSRLCKQLRFFDRR